MHSSYPFLNVSAAIAKYYFRFRFFDVTAFRVSKSISKPSFIQISPLAAEIYLFPFSKYRHLPYWNSTSGFHLDQFVEICMLFCIRLPNCVQIGAPTTEIWRHIHFWIWRPRPLNTTSGFVFFDVTPAEGQSLSANQISSTYLHCRLRYNYFRFRNTDTWPITRLGVTPGGPDLYHWISGLGVPISVP